MEGQCSPPMGPPLPLKVAIVGFGQLGQFLYKRIAARSNGIVVTAVWNRTAEKVVEAGVPDTVIVRDLRDLVNRDVDVIIEVAHPEIYKQHGASWLQHAALFVGSPTAFADAVVEGQLRDLSVTSHHAVFLPVGALWGAQDIAKMGDRGTLTALSITMRKPAASMRLEEPLESALQAFMTSTDQVTCVLFDGSVRALCPMAPNNVNTMALAALASGSQVGMDRTRARLIAEKSLEAHVIEIEVVGRCLAGRSDPFRVTTVRYNPCDPAAVTASATNESFYSSLLNVTSTLWSSHKCKGGFVFC